MKTLVSKDPTRNVVHLPTLYRQWERSPTSLKDHWQDLSQRGVKTLVFDQIPFPSDLSDFLVRELKSLAITPEFNLLWHRDTSSRQWSSWLTKGVRFNLYFDCEPTPLMIEEIIEIKNDLSKLRFVFVPKAGFPVLNIYRSFPWELRENLYVDFFPSLSEQDSFLSTQETSLMIEKMSELNGGEPPQSFCPEMKWLSWQASEEKYLEISESLQGFLIQKGQQSLWAPPTESVTGGGDSNQRFALLSSRWLLSANHWIQTLVAEVMRPRLPKPYYWYLRWPLYKAYHMVRFQYYKRVLKKPLAVMGER